MSDLTSITDLRPTQLTLGLREVERRADEIRALEPRKRGEYAAKRVVPCVRAAHGQLFLIDRHHMCRALLDVGIAVVHVDILCETPKMDEDEFWTFMDLRGWVHPFDNAGQRCDVARLPLRIAEMTDDPYRALAGFLRRDKGFKKEDTPFEEFIWADFLRRRVELPLLFTDYDGAKAKALTLAQSPAARHLPGWKKGV